MLSGDKEGIIGAENLTKTTSDADHDLEDKRKFSPNLRDK